MIISVDIETRGLDAREFVLGCIYDGHGTLFFYEPSAMWNYIMELGNKMRKYKKNLYVYAHNHAFDFVGYARDSWVEAFKEENLKIISTNPFIVRYADNVYFLDTMAFYPMSLQKVGEIVGLEKLDTPEELIYDNRRVDMDRIRRYCERDTVIAFESIMKIRETIRELGYNPRSFISAGQVAMSSFLNYSKRAGYLWKFASEGRIINGKHNDKIRKAFRGSRNEAYKTGDVGKVKNLDINALYPYAMAKLRFPDLRRESYLENPLEFMDLEKFFWYVGVARCTIKPPKDLKFGYLPITYNNKRVFPRYSTLTGTWLISELCYAVEELNYEIADVEWAIMYPPLQFNPFYDYIVEMYEKRIKSEGEMNYVIKLIMNNLYGKFGQNRKSYKYRVIPRRELNFHMDNGYVLEGVFGDKYLIAKDCGFYEPRYTNPLIAAMITAEARTVLYSTLMQLRPEDVCYIDTDSIILKWREEYKDIFRMSNKLGEWKIISEGNCKILSEKVYKIGETVKMSGVSKRDQDAEVIEKGGGIVKSKRMFSLERGIKTGDFDRVGSFEDVDLHFKKGCKGDLVFPSHIIEN